MVLPTVALAKVGLLSVIEPALHVPATHVAWMIPRLPILCRCRHRSGSAFHRVRMFRPKVSSDRWYDRFQVPNGQE